MSLLPPFLTSRHWHLPQRVLVGLVLTLWLGGQWLAPQHGHVADEPPGLHCGICQLGHAPALPVAASLLALPILLSRPLPASKPAPVSYPPHSTTSIRGPPA